MPEGIDTNFVGSDEKEVIIAQDVIVTMGIVLAAAKVTDIVLTDAVTKGTVAVLNRFVAKGNVKFAAKADSLIASPGMLKRIALYTSQKTGTMTAKSLAKLDPKTLAWLIKGTKATKAAIAGGKNADEAIKIGQAAQKLAQEAGEEAVEEVAETAAEKAAQQAAKAAGKKIATKTATKVATKAAVKVSTKVGTVLVQRLTIFATICGTTGPATVGVGCVVGAAIAVIMLAFDVLNLLLDLLDPSGIQNFIKLSDIEAVADATSKAMASNNPAIGNYLQDEVYFDPLDFIYAYADDGTIGLDPVWAVKYNSLMNDYMRSIGIIGDWRARLKDAQTLKTAEDVDAPEEKKLLELVKENPSAASQADAQPPATFDKTKLPIYTGVLLVIILLLFLLFMV